MSRRKQKRRPGGGGVGSAQARANARWNARPIPEPSQVFASMDAISDALRGNGRLAIVFGLSRHGRIDDDAVILHGSDPLGIVPVRLLPALVDRLPSLDTPEVRQSIATYQAEQAGMGGRA